MQIDLAWLKLSQIVDGHKDEEKALQTVRKSYFEMEERFLTDQRRINILRRQISSLHRGFGDG